MEHLVSRKRLWLLLAAAISVLAVLLAGMSLVSAQTVTPLGTASPAMTTSALGTASPVMTTSALGTAAPSTTASAAGTALPAMTTSAVGTSSPGMTALPMTTAAVTPFATRAITSTTVTTTTLQLALPQRPYLPIDMALKAASAALNRCSQGGYKVTVTVVDADGVQKVVLSQDGANPATQSGSYRKAFTAVSLGSPTSALVALPSNPAQAGVARLDDRILLLAGGLPVIMNNQPVAAIGVSGAPTGTIDETCAAAGLASLR